MRAKLREDLFRVPGLCHNQIDVAEKTYLALRKALLVGEEPTGASSVNTLALQPFEMQYHTL